MELLTGDYGGGTYYVDIESIFDKLPFSMQYGVLVDFFHQVDKSYSKKIYNEILSLITFENKEPDEARKQAIQKANELFNNKYK